MNKNGIIISVLLLLAGIAILAMPPAGSTKTTPRQLVKVDEKSMATIRDGVIDPEQSASVKSLTKNVINAFWKDYILNNEYPRQLQEVADSLENLHTLLEKRDQKTLEISGVDIHINDLKTLIGNLEDSILADSLEVEGKNALKNQIDELNSSIDGLLSQEAQVKQEIKETDAEKNGILKSEDYIRINKKRNDLLKSINSDIAALDKLFEKAKSQPLREYNFSDYSQAGPKYTAIHPLLVIIDSKKDAEIARNLDSLFIYHNLHKLISEVQEYLSGVYNNQVRIEVFREFNDMQGSSHLNSLHKQECVSYLTALVHQKDFKESLFNQLFSPLYKLNGIQNSAVMELWIEKISTFRKTIENDGNKSASWALCPTMEKALSDLEAFIKYEQTGSIPESISNGVQYRERLRDIWKQVDSSPLR